MTDLAFLAEPLSGTTLTAPEAVRAASLWWDATGRHLMLKTANTAIVGGSSRGPGKNGAPAFRVSGNREAVLPGGILNGLPWDQLDRRERKAVVDAWLKHNRDRYARTEH